MGEWESVVNCMHAFLEGMNKVLNLTNVLTPSRLVQTDAMVSQVAMHRLKLTVHLCSHDSKSGVPVHACNGLYGRHMAIWKGFHSSKLYIL